MLEISAYNKCGYANFDHRYNVSPIHLHALLGVETLLRCEISSSHGGEYEVQICLVGCAAV
jgi:hypothetical protein